MGGIVGRIGCAIYSAAALIAILCSRVAHAEDISSDINSALAKRIAEISQSVEESKKQFDEIGKALQGLSGDIQAVKGDFIRLDSGTLVLKEGVPAAAPLEAEVAKLNEQIAANDAARKKVVKEIDDVFASLVALRTGNGTTPSLELRAFTRLLLTSTAQSLSNADVVAEEKSKAADDPEGLRTALAKLETERRKFEAALSGGSVEPPPGVTASITALLGQLSGLTPDKAASIEGAKAAVLSLSDRLAELFPEVDTKDVARKVADIKIAAGKLNSALPQKTAENDAGLKTSLLEDVASYSALATLQKTLDDMELKAAGAMVRIIEAKVGDTFPTDRAIPSRWCNATAAMAALCDRKPNCKLDTSFEVQLCGFSRAPSADPRYRGVFVRYQCLRGTDGNFVGNYPTPSSGVSDKITLDRPRANYVIIRGGGAIICSS